MNCNFNRDCKNPMAYRILAYTAWNGHEVPERNFCLQHFHLESQPLTEKHICLLGRECEALHKSADEGGDTEKGIFANWCEEFGHKYKADEIRAVLSVPSQIRSSDWNSAFAYAAKPDECPPGSTIDRSGFTQNDVKKVLYVDDSENDNQNWIGLFELKDGRFAYLSAGCDYTGWG